MTIQEAIKSGKRFRRRGWDKNVYCENIYNPQKHGFDPKPDSMQDSDFSLNYACILLDDWEIESAPKEVWVHFNYASYDCQACIDWDITVSEQKTDSNCPGWRKYREVCE